ncbi:MAG: hypothetical protein AAGN46_02775 [Acidobacteriota bacterium]
MTSARPAGEGRGWRIFFILAGAFNVIGGAVGWATIERPFVAGGMPPPRYPFAFELLFGAVILFGLGYWMVAMAPRRHRGVVWLGLASKVLGLVISWRALAGGQLPAGQWWQPLIADAPWIVGFVWFLWTTRPDRAGPASVAGTG